MQSSGLQAKELHLACNGTDVTHDTQRGLPKRRHPRTTFTQEERKAPLKAAQVLTTGGHRAEGNRKENWHIGNRGLWGAGSLGVALSEISALETESKSEGWSE